jgi:hypothetical protein
LATALLHILLWGASIPHSTSPAISQCLSPFISSHSHRIFYG